MSVGEVIRDARKRAGFTQAQLAELMGITASLIAQYETGKKKPKFETIQRIAAALEVPALSLIGSYEGTSLPGLGNGEDSDSMEPFRIVFGSPEERLNWAFGKLNPAGQQIAADRVEELTKIPDYQKDKAASASQEGQTDDENEDRL